MFYNFTVFKNRKEEFDLLNTHTHAHTQEKRKAIAKGNERVWELTLGDSCTDVEQHLDRRWIQGSRRVPFVVKMSKIFSNTTMECMLFFLYFLILLQIRFFNSELEICRMASK